MLIAKILSLQTSTSFIILIELCTSLNLRHSHCKFSIVNKISKERFDLRLMLENYTNIMQEEFAKKLKNSDPYLFQIWQLTIHRSYT